MSEPDQTTVAVLGTGTMGAPIAANLAAAGFRVRAWNRTRARAEPLAERGVEVCDTAADAARGARVVLTMLFDADAVAAAMEGADGALAGMTPGAVWVQTSTVGAPGCDRLAALAAGAGVAFVDAPVLGTRRPAEEAALAILPSGPEEVRDVVQPVLDALGTTRRWLGPAGAGSRLKVVTNAWLVAVTDAVATAVRLAELTGVEPGRFLEAIEGSAVDCAYAQLKGRAMIDGNWEPAFALDAASKDAALARDATEGTRLGLLDAVVADFTAAADLGHGKKDMAAVALAVGR